MRIVTERAKQHMRLSILILILFSLISCARMISNATKPFLDCLSFPMKNKELKTLQANLMRFWGTNERRWPHNKLTFINFSDSIGASLSPKFTNLEITNSSDGVIADYELVYEMTDSTEYKNISGAVSMTVTSDTIVNIGYKIKRVEMKNGVICTDNTK